MKIKNSFWQEINGFSVGTNNHLMLNNIDLVDVAKLSDRPLYIFNELAIRENIRSYRNSLDLYYPKPSAIFYASKAFLNLAMGSLLRQEGIGIDVCSEGELFIAQKAKIPGEHIMMHGNNKSEKELKLAVNSNIKRIIVDNVAELILLEKICSELKQKCNILLRINPNIHVETHKSMETASKESKFGFYEDLNNIPEYLREACASHYIDFKGIHFHIGSNIHNTDNYGKAIESIVDYIVFLQKNHIKVEELNIGGGLGISHHEKEESLNINSFLKIICEKIIAECKKKNIGLPNLMLEPGRSIVGQTGCTLYKIGSIKKGPKGLLYAAINGGMSDNLRPSLYQAKHTAVIANKMKGDEKTYSYKIVGKCCETGDVLIDSIDLPLCSADDTLVVFSTGAYNHSLANNYNKHTLPGIIFVRDGQYEWVSKEQALDDLTRYDLIPPHLGDNL
ncbi:MAG: diaminopimelate decarboxylase [Alphaproteobacteria bacterium]|nr:diaminopimelate decarboxylase [Alphaproteobacteria bacterium]